MIDCEGKRIPSRKVLLILVHLDPKLNKDKKKGLQVVASLINILQELKNRPFRSKIRKEISHQRYKNPIMCRSLLIMR